MLSVITTLSVACSTEQKSAGVSSHSTYVDLIRRLETSRSGERPFRVVVWSLDGDSRRALFAHPPSRFSFELSEDLDECSFRFGMGMAEKAASSSDGVEFKVLVEDARSEVVLFSELVTQEQLRQNRWIDREVSVPVVSGPRRLILETSPGLAGDRTFDHSGWSNPHLVCDASKGEVPERLVLLVSIDTLRSDHLGSYGYERPTSPNLDLLAEQSLVFENCFAPAPYTLPSHASMLTGRRLEQHRAGFEYPEAPLPEEAVTLAEILASSGYRTVGFSAGGLMGESFGFRQGFEEWHQYQRGNLPSVLPALFDALDDGARPTFVFLHTYDVHGPYQQPRGNRYFTSAAEARGERPREEWNRVLATRYHEYQDLERFAGIEDVIDAYDSGIRFVDTQMGALFEFLRDRGAYDRALIIVTSDHGESLFDRGRYFGHSHSLTDQELRVPLIVKLPDGSSVGRERRFVELVDVVPLILQQVSEPVPRQLAGASPLSSTGSSRSFVQGGSSHLGSVWIRSGSWKIVSEASRSWKEKRLRILDPVGELFPVAAQIYHLEEDPEEMENLYGKRSSFPDEVRRLISAIRASERPGGGEDYGELDGELKKDLRALGYLQ